MKRMLLGAAAAMALSVAAPVQAAPFLALYLSMDVSNSITSDEHSTQVNGYRVALQSFFDANPAAFGTVAIGGNVFGETVAEFFPLTVITDQGVLNTLKSAIDNLDPGRGSVSASATAIGDAVTAAASALLSYEGSLGVDLKLLIDVTTDGESNTGINPTTAAGNAVTAGIDAVNCLGLGALSSCDWVAFSGINFGTVSFENMGTALKNKIQDETGFYPVPVPEPGSLTLLALGVLGAGIARRRRKA